MEASVQKESRQLTEGALLPQIFRFALPLMATSVLQLLFNTADTIVVGRWGGDTQLACETALAAVGSCGHLITLLVNLFMGMSLGTGVCVAQAAGAKRYDNLERIVHTSVPLGFGCGVVLMVLGMFFAEPLLLLMGTEPQVLDQAAPYMRAYFCGMPASLLYNYCAAALRSTGDTTRPMFFLTAAGIVNVVLNLIMVLVFRLGAVGVGIATAASNWASAICILCYMLRTDGVCRLNVKKLRLRKAELLAILRIGIPASIQNVMFNFSNVLIQSSVNSLGQVAVAGNAAAANLNSYVYAVQATLYQAAMTFTGQNLGARKYDRIKKCVFLCAVVGAMVGLSAGGAMYVVRGVTTRTTTGGAADRTWHDLCAILVVDDVIPAIRSMLKARFRRAKNTVQSRSAIRSQVILELENKLAREIITGYENVSVSADSEEPTRCLVDFSFTVTHGINQIWLSAHITV